MWCFGMCKTLSRCERQNENVVKQIIYLYPIPKEISLAKWVLRAATLDGQTSHKVQWSGQVIKNSLVSKWKSISKIFLCFKTDFISLKHYVLTWNISSQKRMMLILTDEPYKHKLLLPLSQVHLFSESPIPVIQNNGTRCQKCANGDPCCIQGGVYMQKQSK